MADSSVDDDIGQTIIHDDDDIGPSNTMNSRQLEVETADVDETDTAAPPPSSPIISNGEGNSYSRSDRHVHEDHSSNISPISAPLPKNKKQKQRDKMQRRVPGSLDLDYITPRIIGMAPPRAKYGNSAGTGDDNNNSDTAAAAVKQQSNRQRRQRGNDPGELSTFLEKRHARRYLLFNVSDEDADDRSLLLLGKQVVHLPWGSPRIPHPNDEINNDGTTPKGQMSNSPMGGDSPYSFFRRDTAESSATGGGGKSPSSGTPAISRVMDICYALHAYLSIPPQELPLELQQPDEQSSSQQQQQQQLPKLKKKKGSHNYHSHKPSTVACIYCGNGKTRTGVIVACYLRFCNEVPDALSGFDIFCHRRGIKSSSANSADDISSHIPPSLRQFFSNFDELVAKKQYPYSKPLMLQSIQLQGVPVDDMPCVDIFEYGDVIKQQIYSSHDDTSLNEWDDEEGTYKIGQMLSQDFTLVCRFGGEFAADDRDPSKVLFRYVNSPHFLNEGSFELGMVNVDMMRRYADSFDEEDFLLTLVFEPVDDTDKDSRKKKLMFGASKFDGRILEGIDLILQGWRVLSDAHLSRFSAETENELMMDSSFVLNVMGNDIDFRPIALQLTNGDVGLARAELLAGMFGFFFNSEMQRSNLDETEHSRSDQKSYLSSEMSVISNAATSQTDQSTLDQNDGDLNVDESGHLPASDAEKSNSKNELIERADTDEVRHKSMDDGSALSAAVENVDDNTEQEATDSNVAIDDRTKSAMVNDDAPLDATPDATSTSHEAEKYSQGSKVTSVEGNDDTNDALLCVMRCCGGMGIALLGAEGTKSSDHTTSVGDSVADSITVHGDQIVDSTTTVSEQDLAKSSAIHHVGKDHARQPSSLECLADALTESPVRNEDEGDEQVMISEEYLKYRRMLKMGLPTGAVKNAMQRDGLDPRKYLTMSKVGLPDGAIRNAMVRDGLDPSLMDVLKSVMSNSDEDEEGKNQTSTIVNQPKEHENNEQDEQVKDNSNEESNPQPEMIDGSTNDQAIGGSPLSIASMAAAAAQQKKVQCNENDPSRPANVSTLAAAVAENNAQTAEAASNSGRSDEQMNIAARVVAAAAADAGPAAGGLMSVAAMAAEAARKKAHTNEATSNTKPEGTMGIAAMAAAAAKKKTQKAEKDSSSESGEPMSIAAMAAAAAQKKTQKAEAEPAAGSGGPMSIAAMAAAAAQKKTQKAEAEPAAGSGGPMSIAAMAAAAAAQKKTQKAETDSSSGSRGTMSIAAMAAAAAQKKTQKAEAEPAAGSGGPMSIAAMAAAAAKKKSQKAVAGPAAGSGGPMSIAAMAAAAAQQKSQKAETGSNAESGGPMSVAAMAAAAAQKKESETKAAADEYSAAEKQVEPVAKSTPTSDGELTIRNDPTYEKFFKMLKMGLPMDVVKHAMKRDGMDPSIMDLDLDKSLKSQQSPKINEMEDEPPLKEDVKYEKYFRMLKMGLPMGAVKNAMTRDGLDPDIMDLDHDESVASQMKGDDNDADDGPPLKEDEKYQKYFKMLKMGLPMGAVKNAMTRDGLDPDIMDLDHDKSVASQMKGDDNDADDGPPLKEDEKYQKYFKMLKMGLPMGAVKNAMTRDGMDPAIMDLDHDKSVASQMKGDDDVDDGPPLKADEKYQKYFKMLKMGLPMGAVKNAMTRDGLDPTIMDLDHDKSVASQMNVELVDKGPPLKEDEKYQKYFKMLKMGLPMGAVKNALTRDGLDPTIMDLDHDKSVEYQKAMASQKPKKKNVVRKKVTKAEQKKPKVRRKKIFWSPIEESKVDDNSLWSMIKGSYDFESLKVDQAEFESLFTDTSKPGDKKKEIAKPAASKQKKSVQVIDAKRGMNGGIILARLKIEFSALADMVSEMDSGKFDDTQLKALREFLPTKEERAAIDQYIKQASATKESLNTAINDFCTCEKYMHAMMKVEMADEKFECMLFKYQFDHKLNELMNSVTTLISACEEVQKSVRLRKLMAMILMLGNQINTGGSGSMAHGFTLDALLKLDEAKAFDKKTSVLQYLVKLVKGNEPDLLNVHEEMPSIGPAESVVVETLVSELKELNDQLQKVKATATTEGDKMRENTPSPTGLDKLRQQRTKIKDVEGVNMYNQTEVIHLTIMEKFVVYAEKRTQEAFSRIDEVQENFKGVLSYFGENPTMSSSDFFGTLNKFVAAFDAALVVVKRIEALNAAEKKKAAAKRAKEDAQKKNKSTIKEQAIKSVTAKINRLTAEKESKDKLVERNISKETLKSTNPQMKTSDNNASKGKLDLTGQRKQFADPFAGPDEEAHDSEEAQASKEKESSSTGTKSKRSLGFFPATSPVPMAASFDESTTGAIETSPTYRRATLSAPHMSPFAKGIKNEQLTEQKLHLQHIEMPVFDDDSSSGGGPPPIGIAAMAAAAAQKKNKKAEVSDSSTKPPPPMGIAAMAAAAAQKKNKQAEESGNSQSAPPPMGIAAMAAASAQKKNKQAEESVNESKAPPPMGIAAMAAAAAQKKNKKAEESDNESKAPPPMGIAAMAAAAAQKKNRKAEESDNESKPPPPMGIAAMAAAAAQKKNKQTTEKSDNDDKAPPPMGIAAMAAAAAQKKKKKAEESGNESKAPPPMGIAAMAAAAAQKKNKKAKESVNESKAPPPMGIAAMAAAAAQKKNKKAEESDNESKAPPPMGIAAMAAAAAQKKNKQAEESDIDSKTPPPMGIAAMAAAAAQKKNKMAEVAENTNTAPLPPMGIAAMAAAAAQKKNKQSEDE